MLVHRVDTAEAFLATRTANGPLPCASSVRSASSSSIYALQRKCPSDEDMTAPSTTWMTSFVAASVLALSTLVASPLPATAAAPPTPPPSSMTISLLEDDETTASQGLSVVTQSDIGKSVRSAVIGGAQLADRLDLKWERWSDSLRDEAKCDPRTNRRMFDNGVRKDGTRIGNPVLGALCTPEPLKDFHTETGLVVLNAAKEAALSVLASSVDTKKFDEKLSQVEILVGPSFERALSEEKANSDGQYLARQRFNRDLYTELRATGELIQSGASKGTNRMIEVEWGEKLLSILAPGANRNDYTSPFPKPDDTDNQPYDEGALLDGLGRVSAALRKLQDGGLIGHWEISIPEDDDWNVVTIAVDDDISIGGQILAKERGQPLDGSEVNAMVRAALDRTAKISYKMDVFFIDPTTTKQELYNPTQLLISLSDLDQ